MKLVSRTSERNLNRRHNEPHYLPWSNWEVCEGATQLTHAECLWLIHEWASEEYLEQLGENFFRVNDPYCKEEYQILPDEQLFVNGKFIG